MSAGAKKLEAEQKRLTSFEMEQMRKHQPGQRAGDTEGGPATDYPAHFFRQQEANRKIETIADASALAQRIGLNKPSFDNDLKDYIEERKQQSELFNFERWVNSNFDTQDPNQLRLLNELYPDYFDKREAYIEEQYEIAKRWEYIKLFGPRDKNDLYIQYMVASGQLTPPALSMDNATVASGDTAWNRGLLNINRYVVEGEPPGHVLRQDQGAKYGLGANPRQDNVDTPAVKLGRAGVRQKTALGVTTGKPITFGGPPSNMPGFQTKWL